MRQGELENRIADRFGQGATTAREKARLVDELARALKTTADTASSIRPEPSPLELELREQAAEPGLPQVLKSMAAETGYVASRALQQQLAAQGWRAPRERWLSPVGLALSVGTLVLVVLSAVGGLLGLYSALTAPASLSLAGPSLQTLVSSTQGARQSVDNFPFQSSFMSSDATMPEFVDLPVLSAADTLLLSRSAAHIALGDIKGARDLLAHAAAEGSLAARFALAETFDPNTLAAWGARDQVADVVLARRLYLQALEAGDRRAIRRIQALSAAQ